MLTIPYLSPRTSPTAVASALRASRALQGSVLSLFLPCLLGSIAALAVLSVWAYLHFGSLGAALASVDGKRVIARPPLVSIGVGNPGEVRAVSVDILNLTGNPLELLGATSSCSCAAVERLPLRLEPGESKAVRILLKLGPKADSPFDYTVTFYTDNSNDQRLTVRISGRVGQGTPPTSDLKNDPLVRG